MKIQKLFKDLDIKSYFSTKELKETFHLLHPYLRKHKKAYIGLILLMLIDIALTLAFAWFLGNITDAAVQTNLSRLKGLLLFGIGLSVISIVTNFLDTYLETIAVNAVQRDLNIDLYQHILLLPGKNLADLHSGELVSHFTNDLNHVDAVAGRGLLNLIRFPLISIAAFIYLIQISWKLSLISLLVAPLALIGGAVFGLLLRNNSRTIHSLVSNINKSLNDTFHGFTVIRSFTLEKDFFTKYSSKNQDLFSLELKDAKIRGSFYAGGEAIGTITFLSSLVVGAYFVIGNVLSIGALLSFVSLVDRLVYPLTGLAGQWAGYQRSIAALERVIRLFKQPKMAEELPSHTQPKEIHHHIKFQNISFSYDDTNQVFEGFTLEIPAGKATAIVGPSGAGKSTLFNLLQRFYQPGTGTILIDDVPISNMTLSELRNSIAYVPQETFLFSGTIEENLSAARPGITTEAIIQAANDANIHDFILSLPDGYQTKVGERGIKLSGGQRQRIAIARGILKDAPILLLDEATSALDSDTEFLVKEALDRLMKNRTTLVIAHRLSTIRDADEIIVLDKGKVVQAGKHSDLMNEIGLYYDWNRDKSLERNEGIKERKLQVN